MRLPNLQKARFCRQHLEIHGNLGGQEPGAKKQFEYLLFEKMRLPTLKKLDFADNIVKFMEIWKVRSRGRHNNLKIFYLKKCACFKGLEAEAEVGMAVFFFGPLRPRISIGFPILSANFGVLTFVPGKNLVSMTKFYVLFFPGSWRPKLQQVFQC